MFDQETTQLIIKTAATFATIVLGASLDRRKERTRTKNVEQSRLDQLSAFLAFDILKRERLVVEQQFRTIFGTLYEYGEILCILGARSPLKAFTVLRTVRHLVEFDPLQQRFSFRKGYVTDLQRGIRRWVYFTAYGASAFSIIGAWSIAVQPSMSATNIALLVVATLFFGCIGWMSLDLATDIRVAERFMTAAQPQTPLHAVDDGQVQQTSTTMVNISIVR